MTSDDFFVFVLLFIYKFFLFSLLDLLWVAADYWLTGWSVCWNIAEQMINIKDCALHRCITQSLQRRWPLNHLLPIISLWLNHLRASTVFGATPRALQTVHLLLGITDGNFSRAVRKNPGPGQSSSAGNFQQKMSSSGILSAVFVSDPC